MSGWCDAQYVLRCDANQLQAHMAAQLMSLMGMMRGSQCAKPDTVSVLCSGTLWRGDELIPGAVEALELLRSQVSQPCVTSHPS
jgi:hypothetical protein